MRKIKKILLKLFSLVLIVFAISGCSITREFQATFTAKGAKVITKGNLKEGDVLVKSKIKFSLFSK